MLIYKPCLKFRILNFRNSFELFSIQSNNLFLTNIFLLSFFLIILTDFVSPLTIDINSNIDKYKQRQIRHVQAFLENTDQKKPFYFQSNMGNKKELILKITEKQAEITYLNTTARFRDDDIWIDEFQEISDANRLVGIRKAYSNIYLCMNHNGNILTQELTSISDNKACIWNFKNTAFGIQFYKHDYYHSQNDHWYLGTCYVESYFLCRIVNNKITKQSSSYWFIFKSKTNSLPRIIPQYLPWNPIQYYQSIVQSINKKSFLFCNQFIINLTSIALFDIKESFSVISKFKIGLDYFRWFLLSKNVSKKKIQNMIENIKNIVEFYGVKKQRKLYRHLRCAINHFKYCAVFRLKQKRLKKQRHINLKSNRKLIRDLIPFVRLSYSEKVYWLNNGNFIDFFQKILRIDLPKKQKITLASYFVQNFFDQRQVFNVQNIKRHNKKYHDKIFIKKFEEIFYGITLSMKSENHNQLDYLRSQFNLLGIQNVCYSKILQKFFDNFK